MQPGSVQPGQFPPTATLRRKWKYWSNGARGLLGSAVLYQTELVVVKYWTPSTYQVIVSGVQLRA